METQNITLAIPKDVLRKAKVMAAKQDVSLSALLTRALQEIVARDEGYEQARRRHLQFLEQAADLGTHGRASWKREALHER